jgi:hypothetical protein
MTADTDTHSDVAPPATAAVVGTFVLLVALVCCELGVVGLSVGRAPRITLLAALLMTKVGLVLSCFMRARASWRASWLALVSIGAAAGFAVVLMLEMAFRVNVP